MQKKERLKPLSLYGLDLREALHAMLSVDPRKLKPEEETTEKWLDLKDEIPDETDR